MPFFECEFPTTIKYQAVGGSGFSTNINEGLSGFEQANRNWAYSRGRWNVSLLTPPGMQRQPFIDMLHAFFLNVGGKADGFRLKDHKDFQARGQVIGVGTGSSATFQLTKTYVTGNRSYVRTISKPITPSAINYQGAQLPQTVVIYFAGVPQPASAWSVDGTTGLVTASAGNGVVVSADCQFHFPVRFDTDDFQARIEESNVSGGNPLLSWDSIPLVELRLV